MTSLQPIRRLAVVNRGEAAMRCIRTVKSLRALEGSDMKVVALYTDVERDAPFVRHADLAARLAPRATPVASYLDHDLLIATLQQLECDAVWPGWGFVAESPEFVDRLNAAGIRFLGPSGDTMRRLGDKIASKELAERLKVPVTAWSKGALPNVEQATQWAERIGIPVVLKASAGGGGRGIRVVEEMSRLPGHFQSASSEALAAFGDGRLFLEKMVRGGRHIEVQIVADQHGFVRALGCRDCSVQRRHQKVIEEAPPVGLSRAVMQAMQDAAERLAREVRYAGVGTVEFLVEGEAFFFMEMNPRLQVEHGITEEITGLDLVELQIRVARGEKLSDLRVQEQGFCIEARVCAEDPDAGFLPAPGRIVRFDPALGPQLRVDTGVVVGSSVPAAFDSMIAKVMARGVDREQARARLWAALRDFDLVIERGASNKGYLLEVLADPEYRRGVIDTRWLDRWTAARSAPPAFAPQALVLAAVLAYRAAWQDERRRFFADTSTITPDKVPLLEGRELDLEYLGESYRMRVFSVGSWRYRVHLDGRVVSARFGEVASNTARIVISGRYHSASYDLSDAAIRIEIDGCVHRFGRQTVGQVRAGAPSMVVSIDVVPGQQVVAGEHLGLLEAMKMEIGFSSPVAGTVSEVRVAKGQQVAAGDLLLSIDPAREQDKGEARSARLCLPDEVDPLAPLFRPVPGGGLGAVDLLAAEQARPELRARALAAVNGEIDLMMLGWDVYEPRFAKILELLEAPLPDGLSAEFRRDLAGIRDVLVAFADVEQLFSHARHVDEGGTLGPSNNARLRTYLRRMRSKGAGIAPEFLESLKAALRHYDIESLEYSGHLERAVLRLFASQRDPAHRRELIMAVLKRLIALVDSGISLSDDDKLASALVRIAGLRGELPNALADTALEAHYRAYQGVELARSAESTTQDLERWIAQAESQGQTPAPPVEVVEGLALAPALIFTRIGEWMRSADRWKAAVGLSVFVRRLYAPKRPELHRADQVDGRWVDRSRYDGKLVLATVARPDDGVAALRTLTNVAVARETLALELVVAWDDKADSAALLTQIKAALEDGIPAARLTVSLLAKGSVTQHTLGRVEGRLEWIELHGLHPETAVRVDLGRYVNFELERVWGSEDIYCFYARARQDPDDERFFVLGDVRARPAGDGNDAELFAGTFERAVQEAARTLRLNLGIRDPRRRMHWNRLFMNVAHPLVLDAVTAQRLARRLLSHIRHLGVEKTIVRMKLLSAERPNDPPREIEVTGSDVASSRLELTWRRPRRQPLVPASPYERKVVEARRRGREYPYVIVRMLTTGDEARERVGEESSERDRRPVLPVGSFEEFDLDPSVTAPTAVSVAGRAPGSNQSAIVFGIIDTPTPLVPEGMRRVLVLSDPTRGMGALAGGECDRIVAAIDLAERLKLPVEWLPISSGARVAMNSGTENMDATARVVQRIVTFTQAGGVIHLIVAGINVGAQSYWDALATMLMHTKGALIMTADASMVLTGSAALAASGSISAEDEVTIGGHERVMGPNGQAQYFAPDLLRAYQLLYHHYEYTYVVPGERTPRARATTDSRERDVTEYPYSPGVEQETAGEFARVGDVFDEEKNPGRKRPFSMRAVMRSVIDADGGHLERWSSHIGAETTIVWDACLGGQPVCLIGIESQNVPRLGYRPSDGPEEWNGGTLFPQSSKKLARALNAASGNRPAVILANLSGFDGSPEAMRKLQLEYGAEIARAVVNFDGPIVFLVVSRYHGGTYVVFSRELNPNLRAIALEGSYASVIGGGPAATVVFAREVRARVAADPRIEELRKKLQDNPSTQARAEFDKLRREVTIEMRAKIAAEFDAIHTVQRAKQVGSLEEILPARKIRPRLIELLAEGAARRG